MSTLITFVLNSIFGFAAVVVGFALSPSFTHPVFKNGILNRDVMWVAVGMSLSMAAALQVIGGSDRYLRVGRIEFVVRSFLGVACGAVLFTAMYGLVTNQPYGRYVFLISTAISFVAALTTDAACEKLRFDRPRKLHFVGTREEYSDLEEIVERTARDLSFSGYFDHSEGGATEVTPRYCATANITDIVIGHSARLTQAEIRQLLECTEQGYNVIEVSAFCEKYFRNVFVAGIDERWFWRYDSEYLHPIFASVKRAIDIFVSIIGLLLVLPFGVIIVAALKVEDRGPVLYTQRRTGLKNRIFSIYKFRTMRVDAEKHGARWANIGDSRVTRVGRILRGTRLDEVPQFWNILKGDMSFVGPRPERPEMITSIEREVRFFRYRHSMKPGLTGWAQINYPYGASIKDASNKLSYDLYYIKNASLTMDLVIMIRTVVAMVKGAR